MYSKKDSEQQGVVTIWIVMGIFVLIVLIALPFINTSNNELSLRNIREGVVDDTQYISPGDIGLFNSPTDTKQGVVVESIVENPDEYFGQKVVISAVVDELYDIRMFSLEAPGAFESSLLVLSKQPLQGQGGSSGDGTIIEETSDVQVNGTVREFNLANFEADYDINLDEKTYGVWEGRPIVVADVVEVMKLEN